MIPPRKSAAFLTRMPTGNGTYYPPTLGPNAWPPPEELYGADQPIVAAYCDGGVMGSSRSTEGGSWAFCHVTAKGIAIAEKSGILIPTANWPTITNNYTEYVAALKCLMELPDGWEGTLYLDSEVTRGRIMNGNQTNGIPDGLVKKMTDTLARLGKFRAVLLDGHPTKAELHLGIGKRGNPVSLHNVWCDAECNKVQNQYRAKLAQRENEPC